MKFTDYIKDETWDERMNGWYYPMLMIPGFSIKSLSVDAADVPKDEYQINSRKGLIVWNKEERPVNVSVVASYRKTNIFSVSLLILSIIGMISVGSATYAYVENRKQLREINSAFSSHGQILMQPGDSLWVHELQSQLEQAKTEHAQKIDSLKDFYESRPHTVKVNNPGKDLTVNKLENKLADYQSKLKKLTQSFNRKVEENIQLGKELANNRPYKPGVTYRVEIYCSREKQASYNCEKLKLEDLGFKVSFKDVTPAVGGKIEHGQVGKKQAEEARKVFGKTFYKVRQEIGKLGQTRQINIHIK